MEDGSINPLWGFVVFVLFIIFNGIFYGFGSAISNISESELERKSEEGEKKAGVLLDMIREPSVFVNTIPVIATLFGILFGAVGVRSYSLYLQPYIGNKFANAAIIMLALILMLALGVLSFKKVCATYPVKSAFAFVNFVQFFMTILYPLTWIITKLSNLVVRLFGVDPSKVDEDVTEEEIISMVDEAHEQGVIEESEAEMIQNIMEFSDKSAKDIMTHRTNIIGIDGDTSLNETIEIMLEENNSRYPVFEENLDNILGIIHLKDVLKASAHGTRKENTPIKSIPGLVRHVAFIPETRNINDIFKAMQARKAHMVIVVDEYGQTSGLVAMEDILEEIVGDILDEYDEEDDFIQTQIDNSMIMDGMTPLDEVSEELSIDFEDEEYETLNGYLTSVLGHIPSANDQRIEAQGYEFQILSLAHNTIEKVKVNKIEEGEKLCQDIQNLPT